jgi:hypothetical protein
VLGLVSGTSEGWGKRGLAAAEGGAARAQPGLSCNLSAPFAPCKPCLPPCTSRPLTAARPPPQPLPPPPRDDFFGREAYSDLVGEFAKWQNDKGQMPLTCHIYSCG